MIKINLIYEIAIGITYGIIIGSICGLLKRLKKSAHTKKQIEIFNKIIKQVSMVIRAVTFFSLMIGLVWSIYYLILGIVIPEQAEYAANMSGLIVSVLTVISIIFAFFEFIKNK